MMNDSNVIVGIKFVKLQATLKWNIFFGLKKPIENEILRSCYYIRYHEHVKQL